MFFISLALSIVLLYFYAKLIAYSYFLTTSYFYSYSDLSYFCSSFLSCISVSSSNFLSLSFLFWIVYNNFYLSISPFILISAWISRLAFAIFALLSSASLIYYSWMLIHFYSSSSFCLFIYSYFFSLLYSFSSVWNYNILFLNLKFFFCFSNIFSFSYDRLMFYRS